MVGQSKDFTSKRTLLGAGALAAAAALVLTACGSSGGSDESSPPAVRTTSASSQPATTTPSSSTAGRSSTAASQQAVALAKDTISAMKSAQSFHLAASGTSDGSSLKIDMHYGADSSKGSIATQGTQMQLISVDNDIYFKAPDAFWKQQVPDSQQAAVLAKLSGKWVKVPSGSDAFGKIVEFADREAFIGELTDEFEPSDLSLGEHKTIDGVETVGIVNADEGTTLYVRANGTPYPVTSISSGADSNTVTFSDWNKPFTAQPPPPSEVVDASALTN